MQVRNAVTQSFVTWIKYRPEDMIKVVSLVTGLRRYNIIHNVREDTRQGIRFLPDYVELLLDSGAAVNRLGGQEARVTPLIDACSGGHLDVVKLLLERGASPYSQVLFTFTITNPLTVL